MLLFSVAATLTGPWFLLLAAIGPRLHWLMQEFLSSHIDNSEPEIDGHYILSGTSSSEFLGYVALVSIGGFLSLSIVASMVLIDRSALPQRARVWALRVSVLSIITMGNLIVWKVASGLLPVFGFVSYFVAIAGLSLGDPRKELVD